MSSMDDIAPRSAFQTAANRRDLSTCAAVGGGKMTAFAAYRICTNAAKSRKMRTNGLPMRSLWRRYIIFIAILLLIPASLIGGLYWMDQHIKNSHCGPAHSFQLNPLPSFVTDELALAKAREAMTLDGYDLSIWQPHEDDRSKAPDGTPDRYFMRNGIRPNDGWIMFWDPTLKERNPQRIVQMELKGDRLECQVVIPK